MQKSSWNPCLTVAAKSPVCHPQNPRLLTYLKSCIRFGQFLQSNSAGFLKKLWSFRIVTQVALSSVQLERELKLSSLLPFTWKGNFHTADVKWIAKGMECVGEQLKFDWLTLSLHCLDIFECLGPSSVHCSPTFPLLLLPSWCSHLSGHDWLLRNTLVSCVTACGRVLPGHD